MSNWRTIDTAPEGKLVDTIISDSGGTRNAQPLVRKGRLWFLKDLSMYVYYTPTHWRPAEGRQLRGRGGMAIMDDAGFKPRTKEPTDGQT